MTDDHPPTGQVLVVIPTYNESENIGAAIEQVLAAAPWCDVLVVDDSSPDGTAAIVETMATADPRVHLLNRPAKSGLGRAYVAGFTWGLGRTYQKFIEMDADLSHDPGDVPRLVEEASRCELVIGSRYVAGGDVSGWTKGRLLLSRAGNLYARSALRFSVRDSTSGFRCYRRAVLEAIELDRVSSDGYAFQIDMTFRAWCKGFDICEIPIIFSERRVGRSKMSRAIVAEALISVTAWGAKDIFRRRSSSRPQC